MKNLLRLILLPITIALCTVALSACQSNAAMVQATTELARSGNAGWRAALILADSIDEPTLRTAYVERFEKRAVAFANLANAAMALAALPPLFGEAEILFLEESIYRVRNNVASQPAKPRNQE